MSVKIAILFATICFADFVGCLEIQQIVSSAERGFQARWQDFHGGTRLFPSWRSDWTTEELARRFDQVQRERWVVYFTNPEDYGKKGVLGLWKGPYQMPEHWKAWASRYSYPKTFSYNLASDSYNASIITLQGRPFLAAEAPTKENLEAFYELLSEYKVTDLIRLTPAVSGTIECSFPYWDGRMNIHPKTARQTIELDGGRELNYFCTDSWEDQEGIESDRLIALVKAVMANKSLNQMICVHCRAGVGRTGTFLAAYALISDIDEQLSRGLEIDQLNVSVDKIVWELSLQRAFMVATLPQYIALYELVGAYITEKKAALLQ